MMPFYVEIIDDLPAFIKVCKGATANGQHGPIFHAYRGHYYFFLATDQYRASLLVTSAKRENIQEVVDILEKETELYVVKCSLKNWGAPEKGYDTADDDLPF